MTARPAAATENTGQYNGFPVRIEIFEGPLDLLLHLVRRQEIEVAEVQVSAITDEYLRYLQTLAEISVDLAGEFLVMAANLMWLKSRVLLPRQQEGEEEEQELLESEACEGLIASETELRQRLEEYRAYREAAQILAQSQALRQRVFLRPVGDEEEIGAGFVPLSEVSLFDMVSAIQEMLERTKEPPTAVLRPAEITVADCIEEILLRLTGAPGRACNFVDLFDIPTTRVMIVMMFLAILELVRRREIRLLPGVEARQITVALVE